MKTKCLLSVLAPLVAVTSTHAALITWGGSGSSVSPASWDTPGNWVGGVVPNTFVGDSAIIDSGGVTVGTNNNTFFNINGNSIAVGSSGYWSVNPTGGALALIGDGSGLAVDGLVDVNALELRMRGATSITINDGGRLNHTGFVRLNDDTTTAAGNIVINSGGVMDVAGYFELSQAGPGTRPGGTVTLNGGNLRLSGSQDNPLRAPDGVNGGAFDFTSYGGSLLFDDYTGTGTGTLLSYLEGKAVTGFFEIGGTTVSGFGSENAVSGQWLSFSGDATSGSLSLVPEPSSALVGGLLLLGLVHRRRK